MVESSSKLVFSLVAMNTFNKLIYREYVIKI